MNLICNACKADISKQLIEIRDLNKLSMIDGQDYIPEGFYMIDDGKTHLLGLKGFIIINIKELINSSYHSDKTRLNGCCGYDGCDGMNRVCLCSHEIGTEYSDCWMPHYVALNPAQVQLI